MRVLLTTYRRRREVPPTVGLARQFGSRGAEARVSAPPDYAAAEERDAPVAAGVTPNGGLR